MKFLRIRIEGNDKDVRYVRTIKDARVVVKTLYKPWWDITIVEEVDIAHTKDGVASLVINNKPLVEDITDTWWVTRRGALFRPTDKHKGEDL